jgi:hypothetical protein
MGIYFVVFMVNTRVREFILFTPTFTRNHENLTLLSILWVLPRSVFPNGQLDPEDTLWSGQWGVAFNWQGLLY